MKKQFRMKESHTITVWSYILCHTIEEAEELFADGQGVPDMDNILDSDWDTDHPDTLEETI